MIATFFVFILGISLTAIAQIPLGTRERLVLWAGFAAHVLGSFALVWVMQDFYGYGDMLTYFRKGGDGAAYVTQDFVVRFPELFKTIFHFDSRLPHEWANRGDATGAMAALGGVFRLFLGDSLNATCLFMALASLSGKYAIYLVFRRVFPTAYQIRLAIVCFLFPSVVFWSSGLLKEAVAFCGLGWLFYGAYKLQEKRFIVGPLLLFAGGTLVGISKAYILFPFTLGVGAWVFWRRAVAGQSSVIVRPVYVVVALAIAFGGLLALGQLFPRYAVDQIAEETATLHAYGRSGSGGSTYTFVSEEDTTLLGQMRFAPIALGSSLLRPFFFEVHNPMSAVNAMETTIILLMLILIFWKRKLLDIWKLISSSPTLIFCIVFVFAFALGVGLATTNLGTLSRYRIPMMPFYGAILVTLLPLRRSDGRAA